MSGRNYPNTSISKISTAGTPGGQKLYEKLLGGVTKDVRGTPIKVMASEVLTYIRHQFESDACAREILDANPRLWGGRGVSTMGSLYDRIARSCPHFEITSRSPIDPKGIPPPSDYPVSFKTLDGKTVNLILKDLEQYAKVYKASSGHEFVYVASKKLGTREAKFKAARAAFTINLINQWHALTLASNQICKGEYGEENFDELCDIVKQHAQEALLVGLKIQQSHDHYLELEEEGYSQINGYEAVKYIRGEKAVAEQHGAGAATGGKDYGSSGTGISRRPAINTFVGTFAVKKPVDGEYKMGDAEVRVDEDADSDDTDAGLPPSPGSASTVVGPEKPDVRNLAREIAKLTEMVSALQKEKT